MKRKHFRQLLRMFEHAVQDMEMINSHRPEDQPLIRRRYAKAKAKILAYVDSLPDGLSRRSPSFKEPNFRMDNTPMGTGRTWEDTQH